MREDGERGVLTYYGMPAARLIKILDPARLLERAVAGLFPLPRATPENPWPTLPAWMVLRQGGLRDDLYRLVARLEVPGWFDPSICLFTELNVRWGEAAPPPSLTEPERHAIVARLLDGQGRSLFGHQAVTDAWVPAVDGLIGELVSEGITAGDLAGALHRTATDPYARARAESLSAIYDAWGVTLLQAARTDGRDAKIRLAREITADPDAFAARLGGRRDVRIVGLTDLRGGWRHLLAALAASPAIDRLDILTSADLALPEGFMTDRSDEAEGAAFARALFSTATPDLTDSRITLWEAPDAAREMERIAVRVRELLDQGVEPTRIAVIARQARPAVDAMATALAQVGVPVTARRRDALAQTAPARALFAILNAARERWSRHSIAELAEHPLLVAGLDVQIVNKVGYARAVTTRTGWHEEFRDLLRRAEARERSEDEPDERREPLPPSAKVRATIAAWDGLEARLARLDSEQTLAAWCTWVLDTLDDDAWGIAAALNAPCPDAAVWRTDTRARDEISAMVVAWQQALATFGSATTSMDATRFLDRLTLMLAQDLITPPETDFGVVVAEALAAGWRAFDYVFVAGLSAGNFPRRSAPSQLFDADEREALIAAGLALDAPNAWRERERELFRVLCAGARVSLTLSWPAMDAEGREVARSAFVDEAAAVLARAQAIPDGEQQDAGLEREGLLVRFPTSDALVAGFPVAADSAAIEHARGAADRERDRTDELSPWNGQLDDATLTTWLGERYGEHYQWSATQLEEAAKCRWHWFAHRLLALETRADAEDLLEPTVSGSLRHDALDRFFARARDEHRGGAPVLLMGADADWALKGIAAALDDAWTAAAAQGVWLGPAAIQHVARAELRRELDEYVRFEIKFNEDWSNNKTNASKVIRSGAAEGEFRFGDVPLTGDGVSFRLRGTIDRIDHGMDERIAGAERYIAAIDYKSSIYSTPAGGKSKAWDDGIVLQVPLYAAALARLRPDHIIARMEYRTLRSPKIVHQLSLHPVKNGELQEAPDAQAKLDGALAAAGRLISELRAGALPARPAPSAGCSPYCPARDICRIPGGPREPN